MEKLGFGLGRMVAVACLGTSFVWAQSQSHVVVVKAARQAIAPPLSQMAPVPPRSAESDFDRDDERTRPVLTPRLQNSPMQAFADASVSSSLATLSTNSGRNILGLGGGFPGYSIQAVVPDTNGAAGPTQFVQFVNDSFAVFNKSDGSLAYGPAGGNTLWQTLGAPCSSNTNLDEIAQFDKLANRWVMMMPVFASPVYLCIAVSTTADATAGSWNLYAFELPVNKLCGCRMMPDYPKLAVWPDGYYISYDQGWNLNYEGPNACVVNRNNMLSGSAATMQCFANNSPSYGVLLPADVDGSTPPPSGSPEYFLDFNSNDQSLDLWQFHVDWNIPSNSTFSGPTNIPVAAFTEPCGETIVELNYTTGACIPQAGTSQTLDSYGDRLMYRLAYRNFGGHQSLVANHTVNIGNGTSQTGIRWYELQNTGSGFSVYQQGTYAPDSSYRWMGSIAMDKAGDIALGYSASSGTLSPTIRYTGRMSSDPLGTMEAEVDVLSSGGIQHGSRTNTFRWGDYSSMAIDPTDDCTFWYTTEFVTRSGGPWGTRIASFSFPSCTGAPPPPWSVVNKTSNSGFITNLEIPSTGVGNLIAVAVIFNGTTSISSISDNVGNTYISAGARSTVSNFASEIWYAVNSVPGATLITPTFVGSPTHLEITEWEVSGLSTAAPDAANTASGPVVASNTAGPPVNTTRAGDFVVSVLYAGAVNFTGISSGNEFTSDFTTNGNGWAHITSTSAPAGSHQASWFTPNSPAGRYCSSTAAFLPAN
jgi:hypothetical protein